MLFGLPPPPRAGERGPLYCQASANQRQQLLSASINTSLAPAHACMTRCRKSGRLVSRTFGADEDLVLMGVVVLVVEGLGGVRRLGEEKVGREGLHGPRAMTSLRAHVILLRRSPISGDSQLSRMGREGRSNPADSGSHSPKRERGERGRGGGAVHPGLDCA